MYATADALVAPDFKDARTARHRRRGDPLRQRRHRASPRRTSPRVYGYDVRGEVFGSAGMVTAGDQAPGAPAALHAAPGVGRRRCAATPSCSRDAYTGRARRVRAAVRERPAADGHRRGRPGARSLIALAASSPCRATARCAISEVDRVSRSPWPPRAEMLFLDLPFIERVRRIHELGFAVEIWDWTTQGHRRARRDRCHVHVDDRLRHRATWPTPTAPTTCCARPRSPSRSRALGWLPALNLHGTGLDGRGLPGAARSR